MLLTFSVKTTRQTRKSATKTLQKTHRLHKQSTSYLNTLFAVVQVISTLNHAKNLSKFAIVLTASSKRLTDYPGTFMQRSLVVLKSSPILRLTNVVFRKMSDSRSKLAASSTRSASAHYLFPTEKRLSCVFWTNQIKQSRLINLAIGSLAQCHQRGHHRTSRYGACYWTNRFGKINQFV